MHLSIVIFQGGESLDETKFKALATAGITLNAIIVTDTLKMMGYKNAAHEETRYDFPCEFIELLSTPLCYISYLEQTDGELPIASVLNFGDNQNRLNGYESVNLTCKQFGSYKIAEHFTVDISQSLQETTGSRALLKHMEDLNMSVHSCVLAFTKSWQTALQEALSSVKKIPAKTFS